MKEVNKHAYGPLRTKGREFHKPCSKNGRGRVKRWAKRVLRRLADVELWHERDEDRRDSKDLDP